MRYEGKHNFIKKQLKSSKNVTLTLANKHQNYMAYAWESFSKDRLTLGPVKMLCVSVSILVYFKNSCVYVGQRCVVLSTKDVVTLEQFIKGPNGAR